MRQRVCRRLRAALAPALLLWAAAATAGEPPAVALIIDDLGDRLEAGERALNLPGPVTYSFLPHTPYSKRLARRAHARGKEVMLHLPMEAVAGNRLGPGGVTLHMDRTQTLRTVRAALEAIPHARGLNNHMGSLLTRHPGHMGWLMGELRQRDGLYFVDSRTTTKSVAQRMAAERQVPHAARDIFLDHHHDEAFIRQQFAKLVRQARATGAAIGIGHPHAVTTATLGELLAGLHEQGVRLVPVSEVVRIRQNRRSERLWRASWSPSPKAARNSKP